MTDEHNHEHDENEEQPQVQFIHLPPEVREHIAHQQMHMIQNAHETGEFFDSLTEEQLRKVRGLLQIVHGDETAVGYFMGITSQILESKFGVCKGCGQNHSEQLAEMAGDGSDVPRESENQSPQDRVLLMSEYGMMPDPQENNPEQIKCRNCGMVSGSLDDRMLRPPGVKGCEGCQNKAKWG